MSKKSQERQDQIYQEIVANGSIRVTDLSEKFNVSMETIRKDLNRMDEQGLITKTHGGAILTDYTEVSVDRKVTEHAADKQMIAQKALSYVQDNSIIFLDPGSTTLALAKLLPLKKNLIVVTNSLLIAQVISESKHDLIFLGGKMFKKAKATTGVFTNSHIDAIHIQTAFMGCDGFLHTHGPTTFGFEEMEVKQHVIQNADQKILLCDKSKFHRSGTYTFATFDKFDYLITNYLNNYERRIVEDVPNIIMTR